MHIQLKLKKHKKNQKKSQNHFRKMHIEVNLYIGDSFMNREIEYFWKLSDLNDGCSILVGEIFTSKCASGKKTPPIHKRMRI